MKKNCKKSVFFKKKSLFLHFEIKTEIIDKNRIYK